MRYTWSSRTANYEFKGLSNSLRFKKIRKIVQKIYDPERDPDGDDPLFRGRGGWGQVILRFAFQARIILEFVVGFVSAQHATL